MRNLLVVMLVPFTLLVLKRALAIADAQGLPFCVVKFDCGCGAGEVLICNKLLENCLLTFIASALIAGWGRKFCIRFSLSQNDIVSPPDQAGRSMQAAGERRG